MISISISSYYQSTYTLTPHVDRIGKNQVGTSQKVRNYLIPISLSSRRYIPIHSPSIHQSIKKPPKTPQKMSSSTPPQPLPKKFTLHFLQASRSIRTAWHLEILQIPYEVKFSPRTGNNGPAPLEFKQAAGGLGKFPTLEVEYENENERNGGDGGDGGEDGGKEKHREFLYESGNICEYVLDLSLSLFFLHFVQEKRNKKNIQQSNRLFLTVLDISPTPSTPKTPSISSLHPAHHSATKLSNGSTPPKPLFCCMVSHVYTSNGINTMETSKKLYRDSVGM